MRMDEFLNLPTYERGIVDLSPKLEIINLNGNLPSLTKLPPNIFLQLRSDCIIAAKRGDKLTATAYVNKESLEAIFKHFNKRVPRGILRLYKYTKWFLIDVDSIETDTIRFYIHAGASEFNHDISKEFPFDDAIEEMTKEMAIKPYVALDLIGFYVSMRDEIVTEYKYYLVKPGGIIHNYRFRKGKFVSKHSETHTLITSEQAVNDPDFGHLFNGVDTSKLAIIRTQRDDVDQRYLSISYALEGVDMFSLTQEESDGSVRYDSKNSIKVYDPNEEANTSIEEANTVIEEANTALDSTEE